MSQCHWRIARVLVLKNMKIRAAEASTEDLKNDLTIIRAGPLHPDEPQFTPSMFRLDEGVHDVRTGSLECQRVPFHLRW